MKKFFNFKSKLELEEKIREFSIKYTQDTDKNYLKKFGQFFTPLPHRHEF